MLGKRSYRGIFVFSYLLFIQFVTPSGLLADSHTHLFKNHLKGGYIELESEYKQREKTSDNSTDYQDEYLNLRPIVHLDFAGSVYHPNLVDYILAVEMGGDFEKENLSSESSPDRKRSDTSPFRSIDGRALILKEKKLSGEIFGSNQHINRQHTFFSDTTYLQTGYGAQLNYTGETIPWKLSVKHEDIEKEDKRNPYNSERDELRFKASNRRRNRSQTRFDLRIQDFDQHYSSSTHSGTRNNLRLSDSSFFKEDKLRLTSSFIYNDIDSSSSSYSSKLFRENLSIKHRENLSSHYEYSFNSSSSERNDNEFHRAGASLRHKLFESLVSRLHVDASDNRGSSSEYSRYGVQLTESYTKRVGEFSKLNLGIMVDKHFETRDRYSPHVVNEQHNLALPGDTEVLNQPAIIGSSIKVYDSNRNLLIQGVHYDLTPLGNTFLIERLGALPDLGTILFIDYDYPDNPGEGSFESLKTRYSFRYSLFEHLISVYGRIYDVDYSGDDHLILDKLTESVLGMNSRWKWFHAGIEYKDYDSTLFPWEALRTHQSVNFKLPKRTSISLSASQSATQYPDTNEEIERENYQVSYHSTLTRRLMWRLYAGSNHSRGRKNKNLNRDFISAGTEINYVIGKTKISATYKFHDVDFLSENQIRNTAYLRIRRSF
ncbi:MAG TPA: hypothetical protein VIR63_01120 [Pontiella sp.]